MMALIKCSECGSEVSSSALSCPKCGKQLRKPKRSIFGKICLWLFYLYNLLMVVWLVGGMSAVSEKTATLATDAERAGAAIGTGLGITMILIIWVIGAVITGLFALLTRPKA